MRLLTTTLFSGLCLLLVVTKYSFVNAFVFPQPLKSFTERSSIPISTSPVATTNYFGCNPTASSKNNLVQKRCHCRSLLTLNAEGSGIVESVLNPIKNFVLGVLSNQSLQDTASFLATQVFMSLTIVITIVLIVKLLKGDDENVNKILKSRKRSVPTSYDLLYEDLYGKPSKSKNDIAPFSSFGRQKGMGQPANYGIPDSTFFEWNYLNEVYDKYDYSFDKMTTSTAQAAAIYRTKRFDQALRRVLQGVSLSETAKANILSAEKLFLAKGKAIMFAINKLQGDLVENALLERAEKLNFDLGDDEIDFNSDDIVKEMLDTQFKEDLAEFLDDDDDGDMSKLLSSSTTASQTKSANPIDNMKYNRILRESSKKVSDLQKLMFVQEVKFLSDVLENVGEKNAIGFLKAILGDIRVRGMGSLLTQLEKRPISAILEALNGEKSRRKSLFVANFPGDVQASQVSKLREEVTAIIRNSQKGDEALLVLQSGGGTVTGYGLAAAQLTRLKEAGLRLTIAVEQVAASGGYMMCCVADKIVASPMAVLGSIGVITEIPNFYDRLQREGIEFFTVTAGKFKRTLTPTKQYSKEDYKKTKQDIEEILVMFSAFVKKNRPILDMDKVATGEVWFGEAALEKNLCDDIKTVDEILMSYIDDNYNVFEIQYKPKVDNVLSIEIPLEENQKINQGGWLESAVRGVARTIIRIVRDELKFGFGNQGSVGNNNNMVDTRGGGIEQRYRAESDATRYRIED